MPTAAEHASEQARKRGRFMVLHALILLEASSAERRFSLSIILGRDICASDQRRAIQALHKAGLISGVAGQYGLTAMGRQVYKIMMTARLSLNQIERRDWSSQSKAG